MEAYRQFARLTADATLRATAEKHSEELDLLRLRWESGNRGAISKSRLFHRLPAMRGR